jgi:hypothetical protein
MTRRSGRSRRSRVVELALAAATATAISVFLSVGGPRRVGVLVGDQFRAPSTPAPTPAFTPGPTPTPGPVVDGVELGTTFPCEPSVCTIIDGIATAWLDRVAPGHAAIKTISRYGYPVRDTNGDLYPYPGSGPIYAMVLNLEDGTERATLVACGASCRQADPFRVDPPHPQRSP